MASTHKRRIVALNAGVWAFALGLAVAMGYVIHRPSWTQSVHEQAAPAASNAYAGGTPGILIVPPITIFGSRPAGAESAKTSEPLSDNGK